MAVLLFVVNMDVTVFGDSPEAADESRNLPDIRI